MKRNMFLIIFLLCLTGLDHHSCRADQPIPVVTTIGQITDAVNKVGGELVTVEGLMGPGVDPHLYKASESDVRKLSQAKMIFYNGLYLEAKMSEIFEKMSQNKITVPLGEAVPIEHRLDSINYSGHYDPHIWFDVSLWQNVVRKIRNELTLHAPEHKDIFDQRSAIYLTELTKLDQYVRNRSAELPKDKRILVTAHDAFRYFGRAYDFEVIGLQGISTQSEAGTADVKRLADIIAERKVKAVFIESSVPERNIRAVQDAVRSRGWNVKIGGELFSDAMGDGGTFEGTYIGMLTHNIDTIVEALR